ncbi:MAG: hypothetical protein ABI777_02430 [Betaproteobacteria bacterium]
MASVSQMRQILRGITLVVALAGAAVAPPATAAPDLTDLWWNPAEPGWGVNFVQADTFIFATFFVYSADTKPTWYSGQMTRDSNGIWKGPLYLSSGSYFGATYNATQSDIAQVGTVTFAPVTESAGTLSYNVDTVVVSKPIQRQTLQSIDVSGTYMGALITDVYNCSDGSAVKTSRRFVDVTASTVSGGSDRIDFSFATGGTCSFTGYATQAGRLFRMDNATYTCGAGLATVYELKSTSLGFEGRWTAPMAGGCTEYGVFSTVQK